LQNFQEGPKATQSKPESSPKKKILIVEDNVINQRILIAILKWCQYTCIVAQNGLEAVQEYLVHSSELCGIFMDIEMPVMNGYEATKIIREKERQLLLPAIPIVGLSGNAREQQKMHALDCGMNDYITKPMSRDDVINKAQMFSANHNAM